MAQSSSDGSEVDPKQARKAAKKQAKAEKRAKREGRLPGSGSKPCDLCHTDKDLLIRCDFEARLREVCLSALHCHVF